MPRGFFWLHNCYHLSLCTFILKNKHFKTKLCKSDLDSTAHTTKPAWEHLTENLLLQSSTEFETYHMTRHLVYNKLLKIASWKIKSKRQLLKSNPKCFNTFACLILIIPSFPLQWWRNTTRWISPCLPNNQDIKASLCEVQTLFLCSGQPKAHSENRQGKSQQPAQHKQNSPHCKPVNIHKMLHNSHPFLSFKQRNVLIFNLPVYNKNHWRCLLTGLGLCNE